MLEEKVSYLNIKNLTVIVFILCLTVVFASGFDVFKSKARDVKRRADMESLRKALELYYNKYGSYPVSSDDWLGWDLSYDLKGGEGEFLKVLREEKFIDRNSKDPFNDSFSHYRYRKYKAGDFGCDKSFYILQASKFELANSNIGRGECPEFNWAELAPNGFTIQGFD